MLRPPSRSAQQVLNRFSVYLGKPKQVELPHVLLTPVPLFPRAPMIEQFPLVDLAPADDARAERALPRRT